jgi:hypothetical protein
MKGNLPPCGGKSIIFAGGVAMKQASKWNVRPMKCPEGRGKAELLLEWKVEKGRKILRSVSCDHPQLAYYSGTDCKWFCLGKISGAKKS